MSFFIFWLVSLPAIYFPVHKIRHLFTVKAYVVPTAGFAFFIWAIVRAHGIGPIVKQKGTASGSKLAWGMAQGVMSAIANFATLIVVRIPHNLTTFQALKFPHITLERSRFRTFRSEA